MKELLRFFTSIIWIMVSLYLISNLLDLINSKDTLLLALGTLVIFLIIYLSFKLKLGIKLFKNKENEE
jgi:hypothetical protein